MHRKSICAVSSRISYYRAIFRSRTSKTIELRSQPLDEFAGHPLGGISGNEDLDRACSAYAKAFGSVREEPLLGGPRRANRLLRGLAYRLIRLTLDVRAPFDDLEDRISEPAVTKRAGFQREERGSKGREAPFQRGLLAIFADYPSLLDAKQRFQMGRQLEYAHYHRVPPVYLEAFLRDVGAQRAVEDAGKKVVHPDYSTGLSANSGRPRRASMIFSLIRLMS